MTENYDDEEVLSRTLEGVEVFVSKFKRIRFKKEAQSRHFKNPFDGTRMNFTSLVVYLVTHYERFSSTTKAAKRNFQTDTDQFGQLYQEALMKRDKAAMWLSYLITYGYAYELFDEGQDRLENELGELKKKNVELVRQNDDLTTKLETCQEENEGMRKVLGKNSELGEVKPP